MSDAAEGQAPEATTDIDVEKDLPEGETFPRSVVEKLRKEAAEKRVALKRYEAFGAPEAIENALNIVAMSSTDEGRKDLFQQLAGLMELDDTKVQSALLKDAQVALDKAEDKKGSALTEAQVRAIIETEVRQPAEEARQKEVFASNQRAVHAKLDELGVTDEDDRRAVLAAGNKFLDENEVTDTAAILAAVVKGHEAEVARLEKRATALLAAKAAKGEDVPTPLTGGSAPTGEAKPEPRNTKEAFRGRRS